jgi:hypothetical protein
MLRIESTYRYRQQYGDRGGGVANDHDLCTKCAEQFDLFMAAGRARCST